MKDVKPSMFDGCPHCKKALELVAEILAAHPKYAPIPFWLPCPAHGSHRVTRSIDQSSEACRPNRIERCDLTYYGVCAYAGTEARKRSPGNT
jgi:glutaredoxin